MAAPARIRTLVVDDSALMRAMITRILRTDPGIDVVGVARNGLEAVEAAADLKPDVVTLDIEMPEMDGLAALKELTRRRLGSVLMVSALDDADTVYVALAEGAVDFIAKPSGPISIDLERLSETLPKKVRVAAEVDRDKLENAVAESRKLAADTERQIGAAKAAVARMATHAIDKVVVIGASTGGPPAVELVLGSLPAGLPAAFVVVQHLPDGFTQGLCKRLSRSSPYPVKLATAGQRLEPGTVFVAPSGAHLEIVNRSNMGPVLRLDDGPPQHGVRPALDVTLTSAAKAFGERVVGVVLTGMGSDGAAGAQAIKEAGGSTIVQDEATAVVFGMPKAVIAAGAADVVAPINRVGRELAKAFSRKRS